MDTEVSTDEKHPRDPSAATERAASRINARDLYMAEAIGGIPWAESEILATKIIVDVSGSDFGTITRNPSKFKEDGGNERLMQ